MSKTDAIIATGMPVVHIKTTEIDPADLRGAFVICDEGGDNSRELWEAMTRLLDNAR